MQEKKEFQLEFKRESSDIIVLSRLIIFAQTERFCKYICNLSSLLDFNFPIEAKSLSFRFQFPCIEFGFQIIFNFRVKSAQNLASFQVSIFSSNQSIEFCTVAFLASEIRIFEIRLRLHLTSLYHKVYVSIYSFIFQLLLCSNNDEIRKLLSPQRDFQQ